MSEQDKNKKTIGPGDPGFSVILGKASEGLPAGAEITWDRQGNPRVVRGGRTTYNKDGTWNHDEGDGPTLDAKA